MKTLSIIILLLLPWLSQAQSSGNELPVTRVLPISEAHTTSLMFPYPIASVDRGSQDVLAQKPKGLENILQIKAAQPEFIPSNLTVVTSNGNLYNFQVIYEPEPGVYAYDFGGWQQGGKAIRTQVANPEQIEALASKAYHDRSRISLSEKASGITVSITGMYVAEDYFFYRITVDNDSQISYDIDGLRFFVRDQKKSKRTASQEVEIAPLTVWQPVSKIPARSMKTIVVVLPKFTIPDKKNLFVQLTEKGGGRHLQLKLRNKRATEVVPLPTFKD